MNLLYVETLIAHISHKQIICWPSGCVKVAGGESSDDSYLNRKPSLALNSFNETETNILHINRYLNAPAPRRHIHVTSSTPEVKSLLSVEKQTSSREQRSRSSCSHKRHNRSPERFGDDLSLKAGTRFVNRPAVSSPSPSPSPPILSPEPPEQKTILKTRQVSYVSRAAQYLDQSDFRCTDSGRPPPRAFTAASVLRTPNKLELELDVTASPESTPSAPKRRSTLTPFSTLSNGNVLVRIAPASSAVLFSCALFPSLTSDMEERRAHSRLSTKERSSTKDTSIRALDVAWRILSQQNEELRRIVATRKNSIAKSPQITYGLRQVRKLKDFRGSMLKRCFR